MTTEDDFDLEAMFQDADGKLEAEPFTKAVMSRISYASMIRRAVLAVGSLAGALIALVILPSGLFEATESIGHFNLPRLSLGDLASVISNPLWILGLAVAAGAAALIATWSLEQTG